MLPPMDQDNPIFIAGCPRSGTTLLGALFGSHGACLTTPESQFKSDPSLREVDSAHRDGHALRDHVARHWRFRIWGVEVPPVEVDDDLRSVTLAAVDAYASERGCRGPYRWVDHTPNNLRYARMLLAWFPEARFVHVVRDPRAVASSVMPLSWGPNTALSAARWWERHLAVNLEAESRLGPSRVRRVRFEDVLARPESTLRELAAFLELPWQTGLLRPAGFVPPSYTQAQHAQIGSDLDPSRIGAFRSRLSCREIGVVEAVAGQGMDRVGYTSESPAKLRRVRWSDRAHARLVEALRRLPNRIRFLRRRRA